MDYRVTFTVNINNLDDRSPAHAVDQARLAIANFGSAGHPNVDVNVQYSQPINEGWSLRFNPDRMASEKLATLIEAEK